VVHKAHCTWLQACQELRLLCSLHVEVSRAEVLTMQNAVLQGGTQLASIDGPASTAQHSTTNTDN